MSRIPDAEVQRLKQTVPVQRLAEARGVVLKGNPDGNLIGLCPFHDDREPSLVITPGKNLWHCLGACNQGGSVVDWVMKDHGVTFREACAILGEVAGGTTYPGHPPGVKPGLKASTTPRLSCPIDVEATGPALLGQVADFYHRTLVDNPLRTAHAALAMLTARKIDSEDAVRTFRLGFADRTLGLRLPEKCRRDGAALRARLREAGIIRGTGHEHLVGSLTFPLLDATGAVVGLYGRKVNELAKHATPPHLYLPGPHHGLFNGAGCVDGDGLVIVCEALIDALTFWCHGFRHVTATYGTRGVSADHRALLTGGTVKTVLLAFDADDAGEAGAVALADQLGAAGVTVYRVPMIANRKDVNEVAVRSDEPAVALGTCLRNAVRIAGPERSVVPALLPSDVASVSLSARAEPAAHTKHTQPAEATPAAADTEPVVVVEDRDFPALAATAEPPAAVPAALPVSVPVPDPVRPRTPRVATPAKVMAWDGDEGAVSFGDRRYRVRFAGAPTRLDTLKVTIRLDTGPLSEPVSHIDAVDLYQARQRTAFIAAAATECGVSADAIKSDVATLLNLTEAEAGNRRTAAASAASESAVPALTDEQRSAALGLARSSDLLARIVADVTRCGVVGEETNKLVAYLAAVSRKLPDPLAVLIQSSSAAGKSSLMDGVLQFVPEEDRLSFSAMTGQSLYYLDGDLRHKVLSIAEEEGASRAAYSLKLLQSEGKISIAAPVKDPETGVLSTQTRTVEGPVALFLTTTAAEIDEELLNRCLVLTVDEGRDQTRAVHQAQRERETLAGLIAREQGATVRHLHQDFQRVLEPIAVVNPFAHHLTFADGMTRTRRDHTKYLRLIRAIAFLHQHQRLRKETLVAGTLVAYIEATLADIAVANRLAGAVLGRSLDELAPQTRRLLVALDGFVSAEADRQSLPRERVRFTRRQVREACAWGNTQLKVHLARLVDLEYVVSVQGGGPEPVLYRLAWDGQGADGAPFVIGLAEVERLAAVTGALMPQYDSQRSGSEAERSGGGRPPVGPWSGGGRPAESADSSGIFRALAADAVFPAPPARLGDIPAAVIPVAEAVADAASVAVGV